MLHLLRQIAPCVLVIFSIAASAQSYPAKPVTLIVPFAAGGYNDISGRLIAQKMSESLGQQIIVENKTGAAGIIGATAVARAKPDGYTLGFLSGGPLAANVSLYKTLPYDSVNDLVAVARTTIGASVLVVHPSVPANNLSEFVAYLKQNPRKVNYGTSGNGSSPHLSAVLFESMAGVEMVGVPYRGGNQVNVGLLGGQVQMSFSPILEVVPHIQAGKLKALAITSSKRSALLPDVPTIAEFLPGYEVLTWNGIVAPVGTPADIVAKLNAEATKAINAPDVKEKLLQLGVEPAPSTQAEFAAYIKNQIASFARLIKLAGVEPQ